MTQIGFALEDAHEALDQFLNDVDRDHDGERMGRWIAVRAANPQPNREFGEIIAHIVPAAHWDEMADAARAWRKWQEVDESAAYSEKFGLGHGYEPWNVSPLATTDRLLPTEPLQDPLAHAMFGKKFAELDQSGQDRVTSAAILCLLRVRLDPDGQGAVPVLVVGHDGDEPGSGLRWQLAFGTGVPGLYVRVTANGFFGDEYGIVTGSGYRIGGGWYERDAAAACAAALGRALPNTDWMRLGPGEFTPAAITAMRKVITRHHQFGLNEDEPEPEPCEDQIPAAAAPADAAVTAK